MTICTRRLCSEAAEKKQGHHWLCVKHYRFLNMRAAALRHYRIAPSFEDLEELLKATGGFICRHCQRTMNWLAKDGRSTVVSLQHYRDGSLALICLGCNVRHAFQGGDTFCEQSPDTKRCPRCKTIKVLGEFYKLSEQSRRWKKSSDYCKQCYGEINNGGSYRVEAVTA